MLLLLMRLYFSIALYIFNDASYIQRDLDWRPGRTMILCSWDAEEYGLIGSYEWTEVRTDSIPTHISSAVSLIRLLLL